MDSQSPALPLTGRRYGPEDVMDTLVALFANIVANPEDDTVRLVYADALDEAGGAENVARAEFIRVQCELARDGEGDVFAERSERRAYLTEREDELLKANRHWCYMPCGRCNASGVIFRAITRYEREDCFVCEGFKDLLSGVRSVNQPFDQSWRRHIRGSSRIDTTPYFGRGFVDSVGLTSDNVFNRVEGAGSANGDPRFAPTARASAIVAFAPTLQRLILLDHAPKKVTPGSRMYDTSVSREWSVERMYFWRRVAPTQQTALPAHHVVEPIYVLMKGGVSRDGDQLRFFATKDEAIRSLGKAARDWVLRESWVHAEQRPRCKGGVEPH